MAGADGRDAVGGAEQGGQDPPRTWSTAAASNDNCMIPDPQWGWRKYLIPRCVGRAYIVI